MEDIIRIVLTIGFGVFGLGKILPLPKLNEMQSETFKSFGLNKSLMILTGLGELLGIALLWANEINIDFADSSSIRYGALLLAVISGLAAYFHIKHRDMENLPPAVIMSTLSIILIFLSY